MTRYNYPDFPGGHGYLTAAIRDKYIKAAIAQQLLPENAASLEYITSLSAPDDVTLPIQFWQLHSVLGQERIINIVQNFYQRVYSDEPWFTSVFERVGNLHHHVLTQSAMWVDVMGGGRAYHGGEFRLSFHHTHNAMQLMNDKGAQRWVALMTETLNDHSVDMTDDPRVRPALNTFLSYFLGKYASEFNFKNNDSFGDVNPRLV